MFISVLYKSKNKTKSKQNRKVKVITLTITTEEHRKKMGTNSAVNKFGLEIIPNHPSQVLEY